MEKLTIKITTLADHAQKAYKATIPELGNSIVYGATIDEIFRVLPDVIKTAKKHQIGMFRANQVQTFKSRTSLKK